MAKTNPIRAAWAQDRTLHGIWCAMPGSVPTEFIARQGPDYVCIDYQHGLVDHGVGITMIQAIELGGATPIARVGGNDPWAITRVLDAGARAVVVPMVNSPGDAAAAVRACRYPPHGDRSFGPTRAKEVIGSARLDDLDAVCLVMVETAEAVANVQAIAATPGLDAIYIGPADLSISLGVPINHQEPHHRLRSAVDQIVAAARVHGVAVGIQAVNGEVARRYTKAGFDMVTVGMDTFMLTSAVQEHLTLARAD